jgi:hypothetical protein
VRKWKDLLNALEPAQREPLEVRNAVLDAIQELTQPLGDGRRGLLHNRIVVRLLSADASRRDLLHAVLTAEPGLAARIAERLQSAGSIAPADLAIEVTKDSPVSSSQADFDIAPSVEKRPQAASGQEAQPRNRLRARLVFIDGDKEVAIETDVFNVGRVREVRGKDQRPVRRNHLYFSEQETSVSRQHAHIRYDRQTGEFRIFDDRSARGTRLFSGGEPVDVPPGRGRGEVLHSGDEVYFGSVGVRFEIVEDEP